MNTDDKAALRGELVTIEGEIRRLEDNLRPLKERYKEIINLLAPSPDSDDLAEIVRILGKYSVNEINAALNKKVWDKDRFKFDE